MSTSLHKTFTVVSGDVYLNIVSSINHCRKMRFSASSQHSISEKLISGHLGSFFSTYKYFPGQGWLFPVSRLKEKYFN